MTDDELIEAYINDYHTRVKKKKAPHDMAIWEKVDERNSPNDLPFVLALILACREDDEIAYVAAGPLKELFYRHHLAIKDRLSGMVRQHSKMRKAIQSFILSENSPERKTLDEILNKYGLTHASF